jgi:hypothetical protein
MLQPIGSEEGEDLVVQPQQLRLSLFSCFHIQKA